MALAVSPTQLTAAVRAKMQAEQTKRNTGVSAASHRRLLLAQTYKAQLARKAPAATIRNTQAQLIAATKQLTAANTPYQAWKKSTYDPYESEYKQFDSLNQKNTTLDSVLNQLMPFDPQAAAERLAAQKGLDQALIQNKQGRDELAQDYTTQTGALNQEQPGRYRALLSNFAGRGLANSSGYATAYGDEAADFAKRRTDLDSQNQRGIAQYGLADSAAQADFQSNIAGVLSGATGRLAAGAGQLGMAGNDNLPLLLELARRRLAAGG